jgi:hypothetical protein
MRRAPWSRQPPGVAVEMDIAKIWSNTIAHSTEQANLSPFTAGYAVPCSDGIPAHVTTARLRTGLPKG